MPAALRSIVKLRVARWAFAGVTVLAAVHGAAAEDRGGVQEFFQSIFGGQAGSAPSYDQPADAAASRPVRNRPLTVRLHRAKPIFVAAAHPTKPAKVSIYADRTLRRGDAVMMADGIHIFAGSSTWPYTNADFVSLGAARDISRTTGEVLATIDRAPRG